MATSSIESTQVERVAFGKIPQAIVFAGVIGAVINTIIFFIGNAIGGMKIPMIMVPIMSIALVAIGGLVYALLGKFTKRPITIFIILSVIVLVLDAFAPYNAMFNPPAPGVELFNTTTFVATELMHLVSGGLAIYAFTRRART